MACFQPSEGILLVSGLELLSAFYWLSSTSPATAQWPSSRGLRFTSIAILVITAGLGLLATRKQNEACALAAAGTYTLLLVCFTADFAVSHPGSCGAAGTNNDSQLGMLLAHLLWTSDACLLMSILGWVTIAVGYMVGLYVWNMYLGFWRYLRAAGEDARLVTRAIASLPVVRCTGKDTPIPLLDGREPSEITSCAICLCDFEEGEDLRLLPCVHLFHKPCIDAWIQRQGMNASCPLCKRDLLPRRSPYDGSDAATVNAPAGAPAASSSADGEAASSEGAQTTDLEAGSSGAGPSAPHDDVTPSRPSSPVGEAELSLSSRPSSPLVVPLVAPVHAAAGGSEAAADPRPGSPITSSTPLLVAAGR